MESGKARVGGCPITHLGIVFHRARPEWIRTEIHAKIAVSQTREVHDQVMFRYLGQLRHVLCDFRQIEVPAGYVEGRQRRCPPARARERRKRRFRVAAYEGRR